MVHIIMFGFFFKDGGPKAPTIMTRVGKCIFFKQHCQGENNEFLSVLKIFSSVHCRGMSNKCSFGKTASPGVTLFSG